MQATGLRAAGEFLDVPEIGRVGVQEHGHGPERSLGLADDLLPVVRLHDIVAPEPGAVAELFRQRAAGVFLDIGQHDARAMIDKGLSVRGADAHTLNEHIEVDSLAERGRLMAGLLATLE